MGRYVTGVNNDFNCKFGFGRQNSNFGRVLEDIEMEECEHGEPFYVTRYVSDVGEYVELGIQNIDEMSEILLSYDEDKLDVKMGLTGTNATNTYQMLKVFSDWLQSVTKHDFEYPLFHVEY